MGRRLSRAVGSTSPGVMHRSSHSKMLLILPTSNCRMPIAIGVRARLRVHPIKARFPTHCPIYPVQAVS